MRTIPKHDLKMAANFFFRFARFEYALKICGYHRDKHGRVEPDWERFAEQAMPIFENQQTDPLRTAIQYYTMRPPKIQIVVDGQLTWKDFPIHAGSTSSKMIIYIRRVRNNLFHGGKFKGRYLEAPERSEELMRHALAMLDACLKNNEDLSQAYNE